MKRLLVLSNGAGEDAIARKVLQRLPQDLHSQVVCCPLVGEGHAYSEFFELCGPRVNPPSEGLFREDWRLAVKDLAQGVIGGHLRQLSFLRQQRGKVGMALAVGDLFPVLWAGLAGYRNILFIGTAKSVYHHPYSAIERFILKQWVGLNIVRDGATAAKLMDHGLDAQWLGNAMMDEVEPAGVELPFKGKGPIITLFPGSRGQAPEVLTYQLQILDIVRETHPDLQVGVAVAPGTQVLSLAEPSVEAGWDFEPTYEDSCRGVLYRGDAKVYLLAGVLGDLLFHSSVALGQAGTANEQAAGAGVPVVAYAPQGEKSLKWYRARQKGLLGDAVSVVREDAALVAAEVQMLLSNADERERRAEIGRERMGPPGGCQLMADTICEHWQSA